MEFLVKQIFSMQIIATSYDYSSQTAHHHKLYNISGQAYVNFHNVSSSYRKVTFSCLCAECDDIEWRRNNVPLSKSSYGVVGLEKEFWPNYTMTLKHSKLTTSNYDKALYSCHSVHFRDDALQIFPSYIESPYALYFGAPEEATYVAGQIFTQNCSARSLYPIAILWRGPLKGVNKSDSNAKYGLSNIKSSIITAKRSNFILYVV